MNILSRIDQAQAEARYESLDISVGELINLHIVEELIISPPFQRLFRWNIKQKSQLIESLIVGLPIPQLFMYQNAEGVYELVDGLQRVSSIIQFISPEALQLPEELIEDELDQEGLFDDEIGQNQLKLQGCEIIPQLNGYMYSDLPKTIQLELKRKPIRAVIIKRSNDPHLRYHMFKRLNSGGSPAAPHEIRNAVVRILGEKGDVFLKFLNDCAEIQSFQRVTSTIPDEWERRLGRQELVLRFFAAKNFLHNYKGSVSVWLDDFYEAILLYDTVKFDYQAERADFARLFNLIEEKLGEFAFVKYNEAHLPTGSLAPAYFEAVSIGAYRASSYLEDLLPHDAKERLIQLVKSAKFRQNTGPGANSKPKLTTRIELAEKAFSGNKQP